MSNPKRHHFVPKWHLERFADRDGFLHIYDKAKGLWRRQKPQQVMTVNRYYRQNWAPEGIDPDILEKSMGAKQEPEAKNAFDRLLAQAADMTDTELASILTYLEFQRIRVPRQAQAAKELLKGVLLLNSSPEVASSIMEGKVKVTVNDSFRFDFMRMVLGKFHPYFSRMNWEVVKAANGCEFIISDSPVSFFNVGFPPPTEAGIALAGTTVFYPFNPKQLLVLRYPEYMTEQELDPLTRIPEPELRDGLLKVTFGSVWEEERVNHTNWIMMQLADRYIGASRKDVLDRCVGTSVRGN